MGATLAALPETARAADPMLPELIAVRDLDAVRAEAMPRLVALLAGDPALRPALVSPSRVVAGRAALDVPGYTAWWLRRHVVAGSGPVLDPDADPALRPLFPPAPGWLAAADPAVRRALGAIAEIADLDAAGVGELLERMGEERVALSAATAVRLWRRLAGLAEAGVDAEPPLRVRVLDGAGTRVVDAAAAVVVESPMYLQRSDLGGTVPAPPDLAAALADLLDLPLAGELAGGVVSEPGDGAGQRAPVPPAVREILPQAPPTWCEHDALLVDGCEVEWWVSQPPDSGPESGAGPARPLAAEPVVHASTLQGLARGLAWAAGAWHRRLHVAEALLDPAGAAGLLIDEAFGTTRDLRRRRRVPTPTRPMPTPAAAVHSHQPWPASPRRLREQQRYHQDHRPDAGADHPRGQVVGAHRRRVRPAVGGSQVQAHRRRLSARRSVRAGRRGRPGGSSPDWPPRCWAPAGGSHRTTPPAAGPGRPRSGSASAGPPPRARR